MHPRLHNDPEKAEFSAEESCEDQVDKWIRGDGLYPGRGSQPSGTLYRLDSGWKGKGPPRRKVPYCQGDVGHGWRRGEEEEPFEVWNQEELSINVNFYLG